MKSLTRLGLFSLLFLVACGEGGTTPAKTVVPSTPEGSSTAAKIAFTSDRDGNYELYIMNADGSAQTRLTDNNWWDGSPVCSPDGSRIASVNNRDGAENLEIYTMNLDGSGLTNITQNRGKDYRPAWSRDGTKIVFISERDGQPTYGGGIRYGRPRRYIVNADGSDQPRLLEGDFEIPDEHLFPWSPDIDPMASVVYDGFWNVYVWDPTSQKLTKITSDAYPGGAALSPDGTKIAFTKGGVGTSRDVEIYVMNADGSGQTRLTRNSRWDVSPTWSPDGTKIAFVSDRDGNAEIYVMNADGSGKTRLTRNNASDNWPAWCPVVDRTQ